MIKNSFLQSLIGLKENEAMKSVMDAGFHNIIVDQPHLVASIAYSKTVVLAMKEGIVVDAFPSDPLELVHD
jgi:hypothetical protein